MEYRSAAFSVEPVRCSLFYRHLRLEALLRLTGGGAARSGAHLQAWVELAGQRPPQVFQSMEVEGGRAMSITVEAFIEPEQFPQLAVLTVEFGKNRLDVELAAFAEDAHLRNRAAALSIHDLAAVIRDSAAAFDARRPRLLDLGGRRRSGGSYNDEFSICDVTVFDIVADPGVDVVGDAHELSRYFPADHFDFVVSVSVFEHLLMPWKVALELNRVMRTGGYCLVSTHQSLGMHDMPWDFWRYSDTVWQGLFNGSTGFEIIKTGLGHFMQLVSAGWTPSYRGSELAGGFESSSVLIRKIGPTSLSWNVRLQDVVATAYPGLPPPQT